MTTLRKKEKEIEKIEDKEIGIPITQNGLMGFEIDTKTLLLVSKINELIEEVNNLKLKNI